MKREGKQRVAMNEATFRKVNEGMEVAQDPAGLLTFVCECGRLVDRLIQLTREEYETIRKNPRRFAIVDGHKSSRRNRSPSDMTGTSSSRKPAIRKEIVERTDPRRPLD